MRLHKSLIPFLLCLASVVHAQDGPPPREMILTKRIFFALSPVVKGELNLTSQERSKIMDAFEGCLEVDGDRIRLSLNGSQDLSEMTRQAMKVLDDGQRKRLEELWIQHLDGAAIADDAVANKIGLTPEQKEKADRLVDDAGGQIANLMSGGIDAGTGKKIKEVRVACGKKLIGLLTAEQKAAYEKLKGAPSKT